MLLRETSNHEINRPMNQEFLSPSTRNAPAHDVPRISLKHCRHPGDGERALIRKKQKPNEMNSRNTKHGTRCDFELDIQERPNSLAWPIFHAVAFWTAASYWLRFRRVCAWHEPKPQRMGGNPFARRVTHGICPGCFARVSGEIISHGETDLRVSVTEVGQQGGASLPAPPARNCAVPAWLQRPSAGDMDTTRTAILRGKPNQTKSNQINHHHQPTL